MIWMYVWTTYHEQTLAGYSRVEVVVLQAPAHVQVAVTVQILVLVRRDSVHPAYGDINYIKITPRYDSSRFIRFVQWSVTVGMCKEVVWKIVLHWPRLLLHQTCQNYPERRFRLFCTNCLMISDNVNVQRNSLKIVQVHRYSIHPSYASSTMSELPQETIPQSYT